MNPAAPPAVLGRYERANLVLPIVFMVLAALEIILGIGLASGQGYFAANLISNLLFLNITHTVLTIPMLMLLPEYQDFVREEYAGNARLFWWRVAGIFLALFTFFMIFNATFLSRLIGINKATAFVFIAALNFIPQTQHVLAQIFGISMIYSRAEGSSAALLLRERYAFKFFILFTSLLFVLLFLGASRSEGLSPKLTLLRNFAWGGGGLAFLFLMASNARSTSRKLIYLSRLALWLMVPLSIVGWAGVKSVHSVEYVFLCLNFSGKSGIKGHAFKFYIWLTGAFVVLSLGIALYVSRSHEQVLGISPQNTAGDPLLRVLLALLVAAALLHYYLDRKIFRMRSESVRKNIAPLLRPR